MTKDSRIFVAGHTGLVGSAICRRLGRGGYTKVITVSHQEVDLTDPVGVRWLFSSYQPEYVFLCAAKVGGILANRRCPVEFMTDNLRIELNVLESARRYGVKRLLFLGSACAYPKYAENPIKEEALLTGSLEPSNECYALAKISGIRLCEAYRREYGCDFFSVMPTNLYGLGDHYDPEDSHVIPGMIRRLHEARQRKAASALLWGTGRVTREFLFADDLAEACELLMVTPGERGLVNVGGEGAVTLRALASLVAGVVQFEGDLRWDESKPDGTPARAMDHMKMDALGWKPRTSLVDGLQQAYQDFLCQPL